MQEESALNDRQESDESTEVKDQTAVGTRHRRPSHISFSEMHGDRDSTVVGSSKNGPIDAAHQNAGYPNPSSPGGTAGEPQDLGTGFPITATTAQRPRDNGDTRETVGLLDILPDDGKEAIQSRKQNLERSVQEFEAVVGPEIGKPSGPKRVDIMYRVRLKEQGSSDKYWYQDVPFAGIDLERLEPAENEHTSIFNVLVDVEGKIETDRVTPPETSKTWKGRKDFEFGKDVSMTLQAVPAMRIYSSQLLSRLHALITYYPSQTGEFNIVLHPYKVLLLHYPMIAAFRATYKGPNKLINGDLMVTADKLKLHGRAGPGSSTPGYGESTPTNGFSQDLKNNNINSSAALALSDRLSNDKELSPEKQIQNILDRESSRDFETGELWKDHDFGEERCDQATAYHIGVLLAFLAPAYYRQIIPELELHDSGNASFDKLWNLFQPGIDVYATVNGQYAGFVVLSCETHPAKKDSTDREQGVERVVVSAWNLAYVGHRIYRDAKNFVIPFFKGTREITSLEVIPTRYLDKDLKNGQKSRRVQLQERGQKYYEMIRNNPAYRAYKGHTLEKGSKWVRLLSTLD